VGAYGKEAAFMIPLKDIPPLLDEATAMLKRDNDAAEQHDQTAEDATRMNAGFDAALAITDSIVNPDTHDDKPDERADHHITTGPGDLGFDQNPIIGKRG